ncbi:MAG: hypothetical protein MRY74_12595 [Neomegalonema sp.]|nr:hypothetical protein [Neomegalonema sp.]
MPSKLSAFLAVVTIAFAPVSAAMAEDTAAKTKCSFEAKLVSAAGSALTGKTAPRLWVIQQCVDATGNVSTTVTMCEVEGGVDSSVPPKCSASAKVSGPFAKE